MSAKGRAGYETDYYFYHDLQQVAIPVDTVGWCIRCKNYSNCLGDGLCVDCFDYKTNNPKRIYPRRR